MTRYELVVMLLSALTTWMISSEGIYISLFVHHWNAKPEISILCTVMEFQRYQSKLYSACLEYSLTELLTIFYTLKYYYTFKIIKHKMYKYTSHVPYSMYNEMIGIVINMQWYNSKWKIIYIRLAIVTVDHYCYTNVAHLFDVDTLEHLPSYSSLSDPICTFSTELHGSSNTSLSAIT